MPEDGTGLAIAPAMTTTQALAPRTLPTCRCGTDRTRREATPERDYTMLGAMYALWGGTAIPSRVNFRCVHCGVIFDGASDVATRRAHII